MRSLLLLLLTVSTVLFAEGAVDPLAVVSVPVWEQRFATLKPGLSRVEAEAIIATVRQIPSTYELYAMETAAQVVYRLDAETVLLLQYQPGTPAAHVSGGVAGGRAPVDGVVLKQTVLKLR